MAHVSLFTSAYVEVCVSTSISLGTFEKLFLQFFQLSTLRTHQTHEHISVLSHSVKHFFVNFFLAIFYLLQMMWKKMQAFWPKLRSARV